MAYKDKEKQREAWKKAQEKKRKGMTGYDEGMTESPGNVIPDTTNVIPDVKPTDVDIVTGTPWTMRDGTQGNPNVGVLGRTWRNIPCQVVDGVCIADHAPGVAHAQVVQVSQAALERARRVMAGVE